MKLWLVLSSLVVFAAGVGVGFAASRTCRPPSTEGVRMPPSWGDVISIPEVYHALGLDQSQIDTINRLLDSHRVATKDLFAKMRILGDRVREEIEDVLTPEQKQRWVVIQDERNTEQILGEVRQEILEFKKEQPLSAEEETALQGILADYNRSKRVLFRKSMPHDQRDAEAQKLRGQRDAKLKEALPAAKLEKYQELKDRRGRPWERPGGPDRRHGGPGSPGGPPPPPRTETAPAPGGGAKPTP